MATKVISQYAANILGKGSCKGVKSQQSTIARVTVITPRLITIVDCWDLTPLSVENERYRKSVVMSNYDSGKIDGRTEREIEIAKKMKAAGITNEIIQQVTGLTKDEMDSEL